VSSCIRKQQHCKQRCSIACSAYCLQCGHSSSRRSTRNMPAASVTQQWLLPALAPAGPLLLLCSASGARAKSIS
jgi:hypothetical protein